MPNSNINLDAHCLDSRQNLLKNKKALENLFNSKKALEQTLETVDIPQSECKMSLYMTSCNPQMEPPVMETYWGL